MGRQCRCKKGYCSEVDNKCSNCRTKREQEAFLNRPLPGIREFSGQYRFLSNFYMKQVTWNQEVYPSSEHAYMAAKSVDATVRMQIARCPTPKDAKAMGRRIELRPDWESVKCNVMLAILRDKFKTEPLQSMLLATGDEELVEGNWWNDRIWGVCLKTGIGQNLLGKTLMQVRAEYKHLRMQQVKLPTITVVNKHHKVSGEYIGRGSVLGNPYPINNDIGDTRDVVIERYRTWLKGKIDSNDEAVCDQLNHLVDIAHQTGELKLQCFCAPHKCHGDVIRETILSAWS